MGTIEQGREQQIPLAEIVEKHRLGVLKLWGEYLEFTTPNEAIKQLLKDGAKLGWWETSLDISPQEGIVKYRGFLFSRDRQELTRPDGRTVTLAPIEADLFDPLISNPGRLVPKTTLRQILAVRNNKVGGKDATVRAYISFLREKINDKLLPQQQQNNPSSRRKWQFINPVYKRGYVFSSDSSDEA